MPHRPAAGRMTRRRWLRSSLRLVQYREGSFVPFLLECVFDLRYFFLRGGALGRQRILPICPRPEIQKLAALGTEGTEFIALVSRFLPAVRTFDDRHNRL